MNDENQALRELLKGALRQVEDLTAERAALRRKVEELERTRASVPVDVYDLGIHITDSKQETCPWTGWPA